MSFQFHVPPVNKLSVHQQQAIALALNGHECLLITGCPGSGKTTVANFRASTLQKTGRKFQYIIYARMLEAFVKQSFERKDMEIDTEKISTFSKWSWHKFGPDIMENVQKVNADILKTYFKNTGNQYDEMIFDETQDLDITIIRNLPFITGSMTICADDAQSVYEGDGNPSTIAEIRNSLELKNIELIEIHLGINYRNTPEIYEFARAFIPNNPSSKIDEFIRERGQKPVVQFLKSPNEMFDRIYNIIKNRRNENIGILCDKIDHIIYISKYLAQKGVSHTHFHSKMNSTEKKQQLEHMKNVVVCTNKSAKGLEFQTVVLPYIELMKTGDPFRKSYYVACTRAERNLFLMTSNLETPTTLLAQIDEKLYERI